MPITIRSELEAKLRARAEAGGITVEAYIEKIVRDDQAAEEEIEEAAIEGLHSGEAIKADDRYWAAKRQKVMDRHPNPDA